MPDPTERDRELARASMADLPIEAHEALKRLPLESKIIEARIAQAIATARREGAEECGLAGVWKQAQENHDRYSRTGSTEDDIRFFALGLVGEAGEVANFVKKRWRDGEPHIEDLQKEAADVLAYTMMLAAALGMTPASLIEMVAYKQRVFIEKMERRSLPVETENTP